MPDKSIIGMDFGSGTLPLDRSKVRELAIALGEDDPVFADADVATAAGFQGIPAPLTWPVLAGHWRETDRFIKEAGMDYSRLVFGETAWEYVRPAYAGERFDMQRTVVDVERKQGKRGGSMTLVRIETTFRDEAGDVVARQHDTLIETGA